MSEFYKNRCTLDGFDYWCKKCCQQYYSIKYKKPVEQLSPGLKRCSKCDEVKNIQNFGYCKNVKSNLNSWCKSCIKKYHANKIYIVNTLIKNKYCNKCKQTKPVSEFFKCKRNVGGLDISCKQCHKNYYNKNKKRLNGLTSKLQRVKYRKDINFRIYMVMCSSIWRSLKDKKAGHHWETLVNYNVHDLIKHLESKFTPGMSWQNYGEWEIDHVMPRSSFNITSLDCADFKHCWSLDNLQPLWATTRVIGGIEYLGNKNKGNKILTKEVKNNG